MKPLAAILALSVAASCAAVDDPPPPASPAPLSESTRPMELGNFSVCLAVKDLEASRAFYAKLGFTVFGGDASQHWLILQNGAATMGLFQGMFEGNIMTFNPGWDRTASALEEFDDVRAIQKVLEDHGLELSARADESTTGPASLTLSDPDGNMILIDQHVPKPGA